MVYIKKLEMRGFKSFGNKKVVVSLDKGFTVVTGPNGSGKSNVIDAVRFVLGELSARSLRAARFSEVIFDGSQAAKSSQSAIVTIHFDNADRKIPIDLDVVTVSRRVDRDGESVYELNGRNISRSQLIDILSVGGVHAKGHNIIMQGTVTRLADLTSEDRRKIVEDLIGIAEYDLKKSEAQLQLNQAEFNLRVAAARIEEVEKRMAALERERNDALRYDFLSNEIKRLRGLISSRRLEVLEQELADLRSRLHERRTSSEDLKGNLENLQRRREQVESEWRRFNENVVERGGSQLFSIQENIGDISAQVASLQSQMNSNRAHLATLSQMRDEQKRHISSLKSRIDEIRSKIADLTNAREKLSVSLEEKQASNELLTKEMEGLQENFASSEERLRMLDEQIKLVASRLDNVEGELQGYKLKSEVLLENIDPMEIRYSSFSSTFENLENHLEKLRKLREEEDAIFAKLDSSLQRSVTRKQSLENELSQARSTAQKAKEVLIEFESKRDLLDMVAAEEAALSQIEEMGKAGAISGILGRVKDFLKPDVAHQRSIEVASSGWMNAIIVKDMEVAARCIESLRRTKLGRIKLIPLKNLRSPPRIEPPSAEGVLGLASSFVEMREEFSAVARYMLGDTLVVASEDTAIRLSSQGFRCVTLSGDLFESGGALESGFYRAPIDLSTIMPGISAIRSLEGSVRTLEDVLLKRSRALETLGEEESKILRERTRRFNTVEALGQETKTIQTNIAMIKNTLGTLGERISKTRERLSEMESASHPLEMERDGLVRELDRLKKEREGVAVEYGNAKISAMGADKATILDEATSLQNRIILISGEISALENNLENSIRPELERSESSVNTLDSQIGELEGTLGDTEVSISTLNDQLSELKGSKERLSVSLSSISEERHKFEEMLDNLDEEIKRVNLQYEPVNIESHQIELEAQKKESEYEHTLEELHGLGFETRLETVSEDIETVGITLDQMRDELVTISSVNLLAVDQYDQQKDAYKQLSLRRNEVEEEKISILNFMEEIEQKKRSTFVDAYSKINTGFKYFFSRLTGGGSGWLELENPEDPFSGGLDIYVQFPEKSARLVSGASGGEKSVAAVAFLFAVQDLSPAPFYVFDEVDAHLDIYNAERLANMLLENSSGTQFIVITLRDVVVDRAQEILGVYIQNGISRVASIRIPKTVGE